MLLNLGCGPHKLPGWVNIDLEMNQELPYAVKHDLSQGLPRFIPDNSVDFIFSEHFVEHIDNWQFINLLKDCRRVLKPGGVIRISTPDLEYLVDLYRKKEIGAWQPTWAPKTPCQMVNDGMRLWGHQYIYDYQEMHLSFELARGFKNLHRANWKVSAHQELCGLEVRPNIGDLIIEATKI